MKRPTCEISQVNAHGMMAADNEMRIAQVHAKRVKRYRAIFRPQVKIHRPDPEGHQYVDDSFRGNNLTYQRVTRPTSVHLDGHRLLQPRATV